MNDAEGVRRAFRCVRGLASDTRDFLYWMDSLAGSLRDGARITEVDESLLQATDSLERINSGLREFHSVVGAVGLAEQANIDHATPIQVAGEWYNFAVAAIHTTAQRCSAVTGGRLSVWSDDVRRLAPVFESDSGVPFYGDERLRLGFTAAMRDLSVTAGDAARLQAVLDIEEARTLRAIASRPPDPYCSPDGLTPAQQDIWSVVADAGRRMTKDEILAELDRRGMPVGDSAIKQHLATFTRRLAVWNNKRGRGYGFPDWP